MKMTFFIYNHISTRILKLFIKYKEQIKGFAKPWWRYVLSWHVCVFHDFKFIPISQTKEEFIVEGEDRRERQYRMKWRIKAGEPKITPPPHTHTHSYTPTLSRKEREKYVDPCSNCQYHSSVLLCKFCCVRVNGCCVNRGSCGTQALLTATSFV